MSKRKRKKVESTSRNRLRRECPEKGEKVMQLRSQGLSVRQIAAIIGESKSVVGRYLQVAS